MASSPNTQPEPFAGVRHYRLPECRTVRIAFGDLTEAARDCDSYVLPHTVAAAAEFRDGWSIEVARDEIALPYASGGAERYSLIAGPGSHSERLHCFSDSFALIDEDTEITQLWRPQDRSVVVSAPRADVYYVSQSAYAALRLIQMFELSCLYPTAILHASAVEIDGVAVLIAGEKASGKTTLAAALCQQGSGFIASDRVVLFRTAEAILAAGWICSFRIGLEMAQRWMSGEQMGRASGYTADLGSLPQYRYNGKFRFPPLAVICLCGWKAVPVERLGALLSLHPNEARGSQAAIVSEPDLSRTLREHFLDFSLPRPLQATTAWNPTDFPVGDLPAFRITGRSAPLAMAQCVQEQLRQSKAGGA